MLISLGTNLIEDKVGLEPAGSEETDRFRTAMTSGIELMQEIPRWLFYVYALSLPRGHAFARFDGHVQNRVWLECDEDILVLAI